MNLPPISKLLETVAANHSPLILTSLAAGGVLGTAVLAAKAGIASGRELEYYDQQIIEGRRANLLDDLTLREKFEITHKNYIPAIVVGSLTVTAVLAAHKVGARRTAAMAAAYAISTRAYEEYREAVSRHLTAPKRQAIDDEIAHNRVHREDEERNKVVVMAGKQLCYDLFTDRYFESTMEELKKAQNDFMYEILNDGYGSLTDYYQRIGIGGTAYSDSVGWEANGKKFEVEYGTHLSIDQKPCITIRFVNLPQPGFSTFG